MPISPITSLAFAVQSQPGVYAALIGSGVSRAAEIPTGWGIVNDLIERLAATDSTDTGEDPESWYEAKYGEPPSFTRLLEELAPTKTDRQALLAHYIEPRPEHDADQRRPTMAHRALARLATDGHLRVFVTTNFDRLLEQALRDAGVEPLVVSTAAAAQGAGAFHHAGAVVFKVHGDYQDPDSMLVTDDQLAKYDAAIADRIARVCEDYGVIACGWSGDWDPALRSALAATRARRYPLHFSHRGSLSSEAADLVQLRDGVAIEIDTADAFWTQLADRVDALERFDQPHPLDVVGLVTRAKKLLPEPAGRIELEDLAQAETDRLVTAITDLERFPTSSNELTNDAAGLRFLADQVHRYSTASESICHLLATGLAHGDATHDPIWKRTLERVAATTDAKQGGQTVLLGMRHFPALLAMYASAMASVSRENWDGLRAVLVDAELKTDNNPVAIATIGAVHPWRAFDQAPLAANVALLDAESAEPVTLDVIESLRTGRTGKRHTPVSDLLHAVLRNPLRDVLPRDDEYTEVFDRTEILMTIVREDVRANKPEGTYVVSGYTGSYSWRETYVQPRFDVRYKQLLRTNQDSLLHAGLFNGEPDRFEIAILAADEAVTEVRGRQF